jgi:hypothetical protein
LATTGTTRTPIVAQTHVAFLKFHNKVMNVMNALEDDDDDGDGSATFTQAEEDSRSTQFHRAKRRVRWHYQWIVLNDFLSHLVDPDVLADIKSNGRRFYDFDRRRSTASRSCPWSSRGQRTGLGTA